jgi:hypothetical protein
MLSCGGNRVRSVVACRQFGQHFSAAIARSIVDRNALEIAKKSAPARARPQAARKRPAS